MTKLGGFCLIGMAVLAFPSAFAASATPAQTLSSFDLPAQPLADSLRAVAGQTNSNILFDRSLVLGASAQPLHARLSVQEALRQLLNGTGLTFRFLDERTITIVRLPDSAQVPAHGSAVVGGLQLAQVSAVDTGTQKDREDHKPGSAAAEEHTGEVEVTGSRIRRDPAETDVSPVTVFSRQDIEHSGAFTLSEFMTRVTQAAPTPNREVNDYPLSSRTTINLRSLGNNTTLVLLNGRRLPKSGQGFGADDYNLNGIPLSSIERIEILTNSASAVYGSDAIGGVINIITRRHYNGLDLTVRYGNTFDSDVSQRNVNLSYGRAGEIFGHRGYSLTFTSSFDDQNPLSALDRPYTARSDYSDSGGRPPDTDVVFNSVAGAGSVSSPDALFDPDATLPGLPTGIAAIPAHQDGRHLTVADFLDSGPIEPAAAEFARYRYLIEPSEEQSAALSTTLQLTERASLFVDLSRYQYESRYSGAPPVGTIPVPADNPFNPFGVDVVVNKVFYELGPTRGISKKIDDRAVLGLRGMLRSDWRYEVSGDYTRSVATNTNPMPAGINFYPHYEFLPDGSFIITPTPGSAAIADTDPATSLNVFGDGRTTTPNDIDLLRSLVGIDDYRERSANTAGSVQLDGTLLQLPAGAMKAAFGGEVRREEVAFYKLNTISRYYDSLDSGASRNVKAAFAELSLPLIGGRRLRDGLSALTLNLAARLDAESLFGQEITPRAGLIWHATRELALRTTYGKGYKIPNLSQLFTPESDFPISFPDEPLFDPATGRSVDYEFSIRDGGNPDLNPERSSSWGAGFIYEPRWLPQASLSVDYFDIDYIDRVYDDVFAQQVLDFFPERVTRDAAGTVLTIDTRAINVSKTRTRGFDVRWVQRLQTDTHGSFDMQLNYTYNITNSQQASPTASPVELTDTSYDPRVRANANLFWNRHGLELGPTVTYESSTQNFLFGGATAPQRIRHAVVIDMQGSVDFDAYRGAPSSGWLGGIKLTLGIDNLMDRTPSPTDGKGGYAKIDPRQRRYYASLRKSF